jgi:hypothetical protein
VPVVSHGVGGFSIAVEAPIWGSRLCAETKSFDDALTFGVRETEVDRLQPAKEMTGVIIGGDRTAVERAATNAVELLKQQKREWSPGLPGNAPRTTQL